MLTTASGGVLPAHSATALWQDHLASLGPITCAFPPLELADLIPRPRSRSLQSGVSCAKSAEQVSTGSLSTTANSSGSAVLRRAGDRILPPV